MQSKREAFCTAVARDVNPIDAYISAGFSKNGARQSAGNMLQKPAIKERIAAIRAEIQSAVTARIVEGEVTTLREVAIADRNQQVRLKSERYNALLQIRREQAEYFGTDNPYVQQMRQMFGGKGLPGVTTGFVKLRIKGVAGKVVPHLETDVALLREFEALEDSVGRLMGFIDPIKFQQLGDVNNVNIVVMQCAADQRGED